MVTDKTTSRVEGEELYLIYKYRKSKMKGLYFQTNVHYGKWWPPGNKMLSNILEAITMNYNDIISHMALLG